MIQPPDYTPEPGWLADDVARATARLKEWGHDTTKPAREVIASMIDAHRDASHRYCGFYYMPRHVIRDLRESGTPEVWSQDGAGEDYDRAHRAMMDEIDRLKMARALKTYLSALSAAGYALCDTATHAVVERKQAEWQPIETAPMDGSLILVANAVGVWLARYELVYQSGYRPENPWFSLMLNHKHMGKYPSTVPTHWRPLPDPPAAEAEAKGGEDAG